jgi:hypothetical protein
MSGQGQASRGVKPFYKIIQISLLCVHHLWLITFHKFARTSLSGKFFNLDRVCMPLVLGYEPNT